MHISGCENSLVGRLKHNKIAILAVGKPKVAILGSEKPLRARTHTHLLFLMRRESLERQYSEVGRA